MNFIELYNIDQLILILNIISIIYNHFFICEKSMNLNIKVALIFCYIMQRNTFLSVAQILKTIIKFKWN